MELMIEKATVQDIDGLAQLYDALNDHLASHVNYPGWRKGIYPVRETAAAGVAENCLFVGRMGGRIAGTLMLRHEPEAGYALADWQVELDYSEVLIVYTFAVHPDFMRKNVGRQMMEFVLAYAAQHGIKAVRLDVYRHNTPAIRLYESLGFAHRASVDLGYGEFGLDRLELYQRLL